MSKIEWPVEKYSLPAVFYVRGLKQRVFFDWDVRGRAASGREDPFYFGSVSNIGMEVPKLIQENKKYAQKTESFVSGEL